MEGTEVASSANAENHPATRSRGRRLRAGLRPGDGHIRNTSSGNGTPASIPSQANRALAFRPASVAPSSGSSITQQPSSQLHSSRGGLRGAGSSLRQNESTGRGRGGTRAGRGQRRGVTAEANGQAHMSGRTFGGQLTSETTETDAVPPMASQLQADAPDFQPGQSQHSHRANTRRGRGQKRPQNGPVPRLRRGSSAKSNAPDIATRIHEDIESGVYECPICTAEIVPNSRIWVDQSCWTVFHLSCIMKWSKNEGSTHTQQRNGEAEAPLPRQWRCPGCNLPKDGLPTTYTCWCGKETDPKSIPGLPPHSCGQTCNRRHLLPKKCDHGCELLCHAGPCPPCRRMGPVQSCFCGKQSVSRKCVETNYDSGWSCGEICGDLMPCGEHVCDRPCHEGLCGACEVPVPARCYCGKIEKTVLCCDQGDPHDSTLPQEDGEPARWTGVFKCENMCDRLYDCSYHQCEEKCHPQELSSPHCPRSPDIVTHCPCGKTSLEEMLDQPRKACTEAIPNCAKQCSKTLACGHPCEAICHVGPCMPCMRTVTINCRCGRVSSPTICHQGTMEPPQCMRICRATLNCGRHDCGEHCCPGERKAAERQVMKRKLRPLSAPARALDAEIEAEHICTRTCGRLLKCGNHPCMDLCHKGACGSCREAIFDEISCHCGKTILQPPLPCGTQPPSCRFDCERPKPCGHPNIPHNCHHDDEGCPKCPFLTSKPCMCGKKTIKNQQCWLNDVRCGEICGRKLKCGSHYCRLPCHRPGECEDAHGHCKQACGKPKKTCGHPDEAPCHAPSTCREDKPCQNKMLITCPCQHIKQEVRCNASKASEGNSTKTLKCDEECARLERNRRLALALNIDPEAHKDDHIPYSTETLNMFATNVKWAQTQEREFRVFATDEKEKRLRFKPMPPQQRSFIHSLAEDFGLDSESLDPEPHRHVFILKTPRFVMAPMKTMAECLRIRQANAAPVSVTTTSLSSDRKAKNFEPFNAFLLSGPRFGLTIDELRIDISTILANAPGLKFDISFLPSEQIVLKALPASPSTTISSAAIESTLKTLMPSLTTYVNCQKLASTVYLCTLDSSLNVLRQQDDADAPGSGWSQVAAKAAVGPRAAPRLSSIGGKSQFTVLGRAVSERKRREKEEKERREREGSVVDDWEEEVRKEEERERREAGEHSDPNDGHEGQDSTAAADGDADIPVKDVEESGESDPTVLDEQPAINEVQEPAAAAS